MRPAARSFVACAAFVFGVTTSRTRGDESASDFEIAFDVGDRKLVEVAVGPDGTTFVAGAIAAATLPASTSPPEPGLDGFLFVSAVSTAGVVKWTSYLPSNSEDVIRLAVDGRGAIWLARNASVPGVDAYGGQVAKFTPDGALAFDAPLPVGSPDNPNPESVMDVVGLSYGGIAIVGGLDGPPYAPTSPFVARLRAEDGVVAWSRSLGDGRAFGLAVDPNDGSLVASVDVRCGANPSARGRGRCDLLRIEALDGRELASGRVLLPSRTYDSAIAVTHDGDVVIGGQGGIVRVSRDLRRVTAAWRRRVAANGYEGEGVRRIAENAQGRVLAVEGYYDGDELQAPLVFDARLHFVNKFGRLDLDVTDFVLAPDGSLRFIGMDSPIVVGYADTPKARLASVRLEGPRPPSEVRSVAVDSATLDLSWPDDGDRPASWELDDLSPSRSAPVAVLDPDVHEYVRTGLSPGTSYDMRLVAVFANGVRVSKRFTATTRPVQVVSLDRRFETPALSSYVGGLRFETDYPYQYYNFVSPDGGSTSYDVEWRVADGPWISARYSRQFGPPQLRYPATTVPLTVRFRSVAGNYATDWVQAGPFAGAPDLGIVVTSARVDARSYLLEGKFVSGDPQFDPTADELSLYVGDLRSFDQFDFRSSQPWTSDGNWLVSPDLQPSRGSFYATASVSLNLREGRFRVRGVPESPDVRSPAPWAVHFDFSFVPSGGTTVTLLPSGGTAVNLRPARDGVPRLVLAK